MTREQSVMAQAALIQELREVADSFETGALSQGVSVTAYEPRLLRKAADMLASQPVDLAQSFTQAVRQVRALEKKVAQLQKVLVSHKIKI